MQVFSVRCFYPDMTADKRSVSTNGTAQPSNEFSVDEAVVYVIMNCLLFLFTNSAPLLHINPLVFLSVNLRL